MGDGFVLNSGTLAEFVRQLESVAQVLCGQFGQRSGFSGARPDEVERKISSLDILPKRGLGFDKALSLLESNVLPDMLKLSLFGVMAHLHAPVLIESIAAEALIAAYNQSMDSWDQSPSATHVEMAVIRELARLYGYPAGADGTFTTGGTQSNMQACLIARDKALSGLGQDARRGGLQDASGRLRIYVSELAHFSFLKSAHILGLGEDAVRLIKADSKMRMDCDILERAIENDVRSGLLPCMVAATVGTTDFGSIDNLKRISQICKRRSVRLHADAAYGSACALSSKYRNRVEGLSLCDSIAIDFHKMFLLPISCSCLLVRDASDFDCVSFHSDYLNREEDEESGYENLVSKSLLTTRRADCLKVLMSFMVRGKDGLDSMVTAMMDGAHALYRMLKAEPGIEALNEPELTAVVFRRVPKSPSVDPDELNKRLRRWLMHEKKVIIGQTRAYGKTYLKFTFLNPSLQGSDFANVIAAIREFGE